METNITKTIDNIYIDSNLKKSDSWACLMDNVLSQSIIDTVLSNSCQNVKDHKDDKNLGNDTLTISEIIVMKPDDLSIENILQYNKIIINQIKKYMKQCETSSKFDVGLHLSKLEWIETTSKFLSIKYSMPDVSHSQHFDINTNTISRSSYKFCDFNYKCEFNYPQITLNKNIKRGCFAQHYVYNYLNADVNAVISYLKYTNTNNTSINFNELTICINTLNFIINHMKEEYENNNRLESQSNIKIKKNINKKIVNKKNKNNLI